MRTIIASNDEYAAVFCEGKCVIDLSVYALNHDWRCLNNHKCKSPSRALLPLNEETPESDYYVTIEYECEYFVLVEDGAASESVEQLIHLTEEVSAPKTQVIWDEAFVLSLLVEYVPNAELAELEGNLAKLRTVGERVCIINGESNLSDNCYLVNRHDGVYFGCFDEGCRGHSKLIHKHEKCKDDRDFITLNLMRGEEGLSEIFAAVKRDDIHVVDMSGKCFMWNDDSKLWEECTKEHIVSCIATTLEHVIMKEIGLELAGDKNDKHLKWLKRIRDRVLNYAACNAVMKMALPKLLSKDFESQLNCNPDLFPIQQGCVVDLKHGTARERLREDMFSFECPVYWSASDEGYDTVDRFMLSIANDDAAVKEMLQKQLGYFLTGRTSERGFFIWWGENGSNGKTTVCNLMKKIMYKFYVTTPKEVFVQGFASRAGAATPHLVPLRRARMAVFAETDRSAKLNSEVIKSVSGNDSISFRRLYGEQDEFVPVCKLVMMTNFKPEFDVDDQAMKDRLHFIPHCARFRDHPKPGEKKRDKELVQALD